MSGAIETDLCVIGGGSAGLTVAAGAARMGARVVLIEAGRMGGDCLNHGCVPSKALIAAAKAAHAMTRGAPFGVAPATPQVDFAAVMAHVAGTIAAIAPHDSVARFEGLGVRVIGEHARFVSEREVEAGGTRIAARRFVIATGSRPALPPIEGLDRVRCLTNESVFELRERPGHLIVIGAGAVGMELAQAFRRLGSRVTVLEAFRALAAEDRDLAAIVLARVRAEGVEIVEGAGVVGTAPDGAGVTVSTVDGGRHPGTHLLVATGRLANVDGLEPEAAGVRLGPTGIEVDAGLRTSNRRIYAIGDVTGGMQFTHVAAYQAGIVLRSALFGLPARATTRHLPRAIYTDPELAQAGLTERAARDRFGSRLEVLDLPYSGNDRAIAEGQDEGRIKVMAVAGRPVGAGIVGAQAGEMIALWSLAISARLKLSAVAGMVAPYPTLSELSKRAAGEHFAPRLFDNPNVRRFVRLVQRWR